MIAKEKAQTVEEITIAQIIKLIGFFLDNCDCYKERDILLDCAYNAKAIVITSSKTAIPKIATVYFGDFNGTDYKEIVQEVFRVIDEFICK